MIRKDEAQSFEVDLVGLVMLLHERETSDLQSTGRGCNKGSSSRSSLSARKLRSMIHMFARLEHYLKVFRRSE
jgi:hypothetical protein